MTTNYHTPIVTGAAANAAIINAPLGQLDAAIDTEIAAITGDISGDSVLPGATVLAKILAERSQRMAADVVLDDRIDNLGVEAGNANAEVTAARTAIVYGTAPETLSAALTLLGAGIRNVMSHGAVGDGVTDDTAAVQSALTAGGVVVFPPGDYLVTGLTSGANTTHIIGIGDATLMSTTAAAILTVSANHLRIDNMGFDGDGKGETYDGGKTAQHGIVLNNKYYCRITSCRFSDLGGGGVYCINVLGTSYPGNVVAGCVFTGCNKGIYSGHRGEYLLTSNCTITGCNYGVWVAGGNCNFVGCNLNYNLTGIYLAVDDNCAHGIFSACNVNHCITYSVETEAIVGNEETFNACHIIGGSMYLRGSLWTFRGCYIDQVAYYFDGCTAVIENCFLRWARDNTIYNNYNSSVSMVLWRGNINENGQMMTTWNANIPGGWVRVAQSENLVFSHSTSNQTIKFDTITYSAVANHTSGFAKYTFYDTTTGIFSSHGLNGGNAVVQCQLIFNKPADYTAFSVSLYVNSSRVCYIPVVSIGASYIAALYSGPLWVATGTNITFQANNQTGGDVTLIPTNTYVSIVGL